MKVGLFDSGVGGLSVLKKLITHFPGNTYVYFADTLRAPFGTKPDAAIISIVADAISFLESKHVDVIVAACNTADSLIKEYKLDTPVDYVGIIDRVPEMVRGKKVAVMATEATVRTGVYAKLLKGLEIYQKAAQLLVSAVESEPGSEKIINAIIKHYLLPIKRWKPDEIVLGCTHFPLVSKFISSFIPNARLIDPADGIVQKLSKMKHGKGKGMIEFYVSGDVGDFERKVRRFGIGKIMPMTFQKVKVEEGIAVEEDSGNIWAIRSG